MAGQFSCGPLEVPSEPAADRELSPQVGTRELTRDEDGTMAVEVSMSHDSFKLVIVVSSEDRAVQKAYTLRLARPGRKFFPEDYWARIWGCGDQHGPCGW